VDRTAVHRFASTPPARIVPALADEGIYVASEASFHRVLRDHGQMQRRGQARPPRSAGPPSTHVATGPGQVWCWDVTLILLRKSTSDALLRRGYAAFGTRLTS
jgi:hypothetical protein